MRLRLLTRWLAAGMLLWSVPLLAPAAIAEPELPTPKGEKCVQPTQEMREHHMDLILHQRDETMHEGIRTERYSLKHCIECHAAKDTAGDWIPPTSNKHFCQACHAYAGVTIDCFECHAGKP